MISNLRSFGLTLIAVATVAAMIAPASSANEAGIFSAGSYPAHISGIDVDDTITTSGTTLACKTTTYTGTLGGASTQLTLTPTYKDCTKDGTPATITMNGCAYIFNVGSGTGAHWNGTVHIECPGSVIEIHRYASSVTHAEGKSNCTVTIFEQPNLTGITYTNNAPTNRIVIEGTFSPAIQLHGSCSFGFTINTTATYHLGVEIEGANGNAIHVTPHPIA